jgi:Flp pilus assembly protein TadB
VTAAAGALAGGSILSVGVVANAVLAVVAPLAVVPVLAGGGVAWALARGHRTMVSRTQVALERVLDQVEHDAPAATAAPLASALREVLDGVRRARR